VFGIATQARNDVQGIGRSIFDNTAFWGSAGRLSSVVARNFGNNGPTLHEIMHRWGASLSTGFGFQQCSGGHWGVAGAGRAQLGGFDPATLVDEGGGEYTAGSFSSFANGGDSVDYSMLELYVAGLASAAEVPDIPIPQNVDCGSFACDDPSCSRVRFSAGALETVTIDDIIALHGPRVPDSSTAPSHFDASLVVFSQKALNDTEMAYFNVQSMELGDLAPPGFPKSFAEATLGRGSMSTVPEPGGVVSLLCGFALLGWLHRSRRKGASAGESREPTRMHPIEGLRVEDDRSGGLLVAYSPVLPYFPIPYFPRARPGSPSRLRAFTAAFAFSIFSGPSCSANRRS
jgi:hypothetical protein